MTSKLGAAAEIALSDRLAAEAEAASRLFTLRSLLPLLALLLLGWLLARLAIPLARVAWRAGLDRRRRLAASGTAIRAITGVWIAWVVARRLFSVAPALATGVVGVALGVMLLVLARSAQNVYVGLGLLARRRVREGDQITIGEQTGLVREVGLVRLHLGAADGASIFVPNRLLDERPVVVQRARGSAPASVRFPLDEPASPAAVELARRAALLSPYRAPGSRVVVSREPGPALRVDIQVWSDLAVRAASAQVEESLRAALEPLRRREAK